MITRLLTARIYFKRPNKKKWLNFLYKKTLYLRNLQLVKSDASDLSVFPQLDIINLSLYDTNYSCAQLQVSRINSSQCKGNSQTRR